MTAYMETTLPPCRLQHILLAEDNLFNQQLTRAILEEQGCLVTVADDGADAVALFREQPFDLILMDICMPRMDGYQATRAIRAIERDQGGRIPIFALTANDGPEERQACLNSGLDAVLIKPFSFQDLMEGIAQCRDHGAEPAQQAEIRVAAAGRSALLSDRIRADFSASPERLAAFFDLLCRDLDTQTAAMYAACEAGDREALRGAAHAAKGVARGLLDQSLGRLAEEVERQAPGGDLSGIRETLSVMGRLVAELKGP